MSVTSETDAVEAVIDLLQNASDTEWDTDTPDVRRYWDDAGAERGPGAGQPPVAYVWSPTASTLEQFSRDGTRFDREDTVEVQLWSLDAAVTQQLQDNVVTVLSQYLNDNETETVFSTVKPVSRSDFREQTQRRPTDHYIQSVEVEPRRLSDTGKA